MPAHESKMGELHEKVAEKILMALESEDVDPRIIASAITFLNNNKVKMDPASDNKTSVIQERLAERRARLALVKNEAEDAARRFASDAN